jgi:hypothetical protein
LQGFISVRAIAAADHSVNAVIRQQLDHLRTSAPLGIRCRVIYFLPGFAFRVGD